MRLFTQILAALALLAALLSGTASVQAQLFPGTGSSTCDPTKMSCVPPPATCSPADQLLGKCGGSGTPPGGGTCSPSPGGQPCNGGSQAASLGNDSGTNQGAGNPINIINGNKYQQEVDLPALPGVLGLEIIRHYNSQYSLPNVPNGALGRGWKLSYETDLYATSNTIQIIQADGTRLIFNRDPNHPSLCSTANPGNGKLLIEKKSSGDEYTWTWPNGRQLNFNSDGKLVQIAAPTGEFVSLTRDAKGMLVKVTDPQGRSLHLNYLDNQSARQGDRFRGVQSIDSPVGRFSYSYGSPAPQGSTLDKTLLLANLVKVTIPTSYDAEKKVHAYTERGVSESTISRSYHYEDPHFPTLLTGISVHGSGSDGKLVDQRLSTWIYDQNGRGILSVKGSPARLQTDKDGKPLEPKRLVPGTGLEQVIFDRKQTNKVILTNSLGQTTSYSYAIIGGEYRLLEVRGAGCASCGPSNMRYRYDALGRMTESTQLDDGGQPMASRKTEFDAYGRTLRISRIGYANGKAQAPQWLSRYEYAAVDQRNPAAQASMTPTLIARPSVIAGKEAVTRISYNEQGQVTRVSESGFAPAVDDKTPSAVIERSTSYAYSQINGRSLLSRIDGPLANGPKNDPSDSDVTLFKYANHGSYPTEITAPGNVLTRIVRSANDSRPIEISVNDGDRILQTKAVYSPMGQVQAITQIGTLLNAQGQPDQATQRQRALTASYDAAGRLDTVDWLGQRVDDALIAQVNALHGFPSQLIPVVANTAGNDPAATSMPAAERDAMQRPTAWNDVGGSPLLKAIWGETGTAAQGTILQLESINGVAQRLVDDFGRVVAIRSPEQGWQSAQYDQANRLVRIVDPRGAIQIVHYDLRGRSVRLERFAVNHSSASAEENLEFIYSAGKNEETVQDKYGKRTTLIRYDAFGDETGSTQTIALNGATPLSFSLDQALDAQGKRQRSKLTDASGNFSELTNTYDAGGRLQKINSNGLLPAWLGGQRAVIADIDWKQYKQHQFAAQLSHGNGLHENWGGSNESIEQAADRKTLPSAAAAELHRPGEDHDAAGLPASIETSAGSLRLTWDAAGRLHQVNHPDSAADIYIYDARGRRVAKMDAFNTATGKPSRITYFVYDGVQLAAEADDDGRVSQRYVYLGWRPVAQLDSSNRDLWARLKDKLFGPQVRALSTDRAGQVIAMSDANREVLWQAVQSNAKSETSHQPLRFVGQYFDEETRLSYHGARFFDAQTAMFLSPDPEGVGDAMTQTRSDFLLNAYAYAGGQPALFFDPDGAAKFTYYLITAKADGSTSLGKNQGFTKGRWAFSITDIQGGVKSNVLYDPTGGFISGQASYAGKQGDAFGWSAADQAAVGDPIAAMQAYYGDNLISVSQFTIDDFNDATARAILNKLGYADPNATCAATLPQINFGPGEAAIDVTKASANGASKQRLLNCQANQSSTMPVTYADDTERNRVEKYEAAAELNETSALGKDCSSNGCPGVDIVGQSGVVYHASYGRSQFTAQTFLETINSKLSAAEKQALGITPDMQSRITSGIARGLAVGGQNKIFQQVREKYQCSGAAAAWDNAGQPGAMTVAERTDFQTRSQLGRQAFIDMVCFTPQGNARPIGEGRNAFMTESIFADATLKTWMMNIFKSDDQFGYISRILIRNNLREVVGDSSLSSHFSNTEAPQTADGQDNPAYATRQRTVEEEIAMRVGRLHNGGKATALSSDTSVLTRACVASGPNANTPLCDIGNYVKKFIGIIDDGHGNWRSLRCISDPKTGTGGDASPRGIEVKPINF